MEYIVGIVLIVLVFKFFIRNKHLFFIEDNSKTENHYIANKLNYSKYDHKITSNNFKLRPSLMNNNERLFFEQLKIAIGGAYDIYPQVHLGAIFQPISFGQNWAELNKLNKKIDFVLFDKNTQTPKIAIELDGDSHSKYNSFKRDEFVGQIFTKFNIPLIRFNNGNYSAQDIKSKLSEL